MGGISQGAGNANHKGSLSCFVVVPVADTTKGEWVVTNSNRVGRQRNGGVAKKGYELVVAGGDGVQKGGVPGIQCW